MGERGRLISWPVRSGLFPPVADAFIAREAVPGIRQALMPAGSVALVADGTPGGSSTGRDRPCGRTQLASWAAGALWNARAADLLAWVPASSRVSVLSAYVRVAAELGLDHGDADLVAARLLAWLAGTRRPWLIVLDDLRDGADMTGLWPGGPAGRVLVTAADTTVLAGGPQALEVRVPPFSLREAMGFLSARLTEDPDQRNGAIDLAGVTGGEPAALAMAAEVIAATGVSCREYLCWFTQRRDELAPAGYASSPADVAWTLSADVAGQMIPAGGTWPLLVLAALLDGSGIPAIVFTAPAVRGYLAGPDSGSALAPGEAQAMVLALARAGLLTIDATAPAGPVARMSRQVQQAVLAAAPPGLAGRAACAAASALVQAWPGEQPHSWLAAALRSSAAALQHAAGDVLWAEGCHRLLPAAGRSLEDAGMAGPAASWWRMVAGGASRLLGPEHPDTLASASRLAAALVTAGEPAEAVTWAELALAGWARIRGTADPAAITAQVTLGRCLAAAGKAGDAAAVLDHAARLSEQMHGGGDPGTLAARDEHAVVLLAAGHRAEAVRCCQQAVSGYERRYGEVHAAALAARARLAAACLAAGLPQDAVTEYGRVLAAREKACGADHLDTLAARTGLAGALTAAGDISAALQHRQQACAGYVRVLGADHPDALAARADLARAYSAAGQLGDAVLELRDAIRCSERALSPGDPMTVALREALACMGGVTR
jgi:tetratricopeptide (TPR) repeat protein